MPRARRVSVLALCCVFLLLASCVKNTITGYDTKCSPQVMSAYDGEWNPVKWRNFEYKPGADGTVGEYSKKREARTLTRSSWYEIKAGCCIHHGRTSLTSGSSLLYGHGMQQKSPTMLWFGSNVGEYEFEALDDDIAVLRHVRHTSVNSFIRAMTGNDYITGGETILCRDGSGAEERAWAVGDTGLEQSPLVRKMRADLPALSLARAKAIKTGHEGEVFPGPISGDHAIIYGKLLIDCKCAYPYRAYKVDIATYEVDESQGRRGMIFHPWGSLPVGRDGTFAAYNVPRQGYSISKVYCRNDQNIFLEIDYSRYLGIFGDVQVIYMGVNIYEMDEKANTAFQKYFGRTPNKSDVESDEFFNRPENRNWKPAYEKYCSADAK